MNKKPHNCLDWLAHTALIAFGLTRKRSHCQKCGATIAKRGY